MRDIKLADNVIFGKDRFNVIAGPCSIESLEQMEKTIVFLLQKGVKIIRGGIFKPRTNPEDFQGLGKLGINIIKELKKKHDFLFVTEAMDLDHIDELVEIADILQVGSRNMHNFSLLKKIGLYNKPVILKRGMSAEINEWKMAAEYISKSGNEDIIFCERGIRTFEKYTRNTLDLVAVPIMQKETNKPVIVDPSHGIGIREFIPRACLASKAIGANGIMIEVHPNPKEAKSDGKQSLDFSEFSDLMDSLK